MTVKFKVISTGVSNIATSAYLFSMRSVASEHPDGKGGKRAIYRNETIRLEGEGTISKAQLELLRKSPSFLAKVREGFLKFEDKALMKEYRANHKDAEERARKLSAIIEDRKEQAVERRDNETEIAELKAENSALNDRLVKLEAMVNNQKTAPAKPPAAKTDAPKASELESGQTVKAS